MYICMYTYMYMYMRMSTWIYTSTLLLRSRALLVQAYSYHLGLGFSPLIQDSRVLDPVALFPACMETQETSDPEP